MKTHTRHIMSTLILSAALPIGAFCQEAQQDPIDPEIAKINAKYTTAYEQLEKQGKQLEEDAPKGAENAAKIDVDLSKWHDVSFDVPEFRMKRQNIIFDIPSVTMKLKKISWDAPEVRMVNKKVGQYPVFHDFTVEWKDIITSVPETRMVRHDASLDVPEFRMNRTEISFDIPEVFRTRQVSLRIPEIKVRPTDEAKAEIEDRSKDMEKSAKALAAAQSTEIKAVSIKLLMKKRIALEADAKKVATDLTNAIEQTKKAGANPAALTNDKGEKINLLTILTDTNKKFADGIAKIDAAIAELQK